MSKVVLPKDFGVPVPATTPAATDHLILYYGPTGFAPDYNQANRIDCGPVSGLATKTVNGIDYYDDPVGGELPQPFPPGDYDFVYTLEDANGDEGNFSPPLTVNISVPPTLGQPIRLD